MADDLAGAASAQPAAPAPSTASPSPAPVSAERAAADAGDFGAFDAAHTARRQGKSVPPPPPAAPAQPAERGETPPPGAADAQPQVSKRQQAINDYERRIAAQEQRIQELEARTRAAQPPPPPPPSNGPPPPPDNQHKARVARYLALPDAPKIDDFDTYPEYTAAQTLFLQDKLQAEQAQVQGRHQALVARDQTFRARLIEAKTADPAFVESLSDEAKNLGGMDHARRSGVAPGPEHVIGELVYDSPQAVPFLKYISANPDALRALVTPPPALQQLPPQWRAKAHVDHLVTEFRRLEGRLAYEASLSAPDTALGEPPSPPSSVSSAPPPPPTLGKAGRSTDPVRSALARNDFAAFDQAEQATRAARRAGRAS